MFQKMSGECKSPEVGEVLHVLETARLENVKHIDYGDGWKQGTPGLGGAGSLRSR